MSEQAFNPRKFINSLDTNCFCCWKLTLVRRTLIFDLLCTNHLILGRCWRYYVSLWIHGSHIFLYLHPNFAEWRYYMITNLFVIFLDAVIPNQPKSRTQHVLYNTVYQLSIYFRGSISPVSFECELNIGMPSICSYITCTSLT